ncbi:putative Response regulator [Gammaproteobacteria bacterium]
MAKFNVLVVDDANFIREFIKRGLTTSIPNVVVHDALNGRHAQDILTTKPVDLILCDWEMPEVDGHDLLLWVRSDDRFRDLPFVMVTSRGEKTHVVNALRSGIDGYVVKPFSIDTLMGKINEAMTRRGRTIAPEPRSAVPSALPFSDSVSILTGGHKKEAKEPAKPTGPCADSVAILTGSYKKETPKPALPFSDSVSILTGNYKKDAKEAPKPAVPFADSVAILTGNYKKGTKDAKEAKEAEAKEARGPDRGRNLLSRVTAQLRHDGRAMRCLVQRLDLNGALAVIPQEESCPAVADHVVFALALDSPAIQVKDLNAVVSAVEQIESRSENRFVRLTLRFVDEDPKKNEALSRLITSV